MRAYEKPTFENAGTLQAITAVSIVSPLFNDNDPPPPPSGEENDNDSSPPPSEEEEGS